MSGLFASSKRWTNWEEDRGEWREGSYLENKISKDTLKETGLFKEQTEEGFDNGLKKLKRIFPPCL